MERAILVTVDLKSENGWSIEDRASELRELVWSSGVLRDTEILCTRERPTPDLFIGKGKFEEIARLCREKNIDVVIFNNDLSPTQLRNLERGLNGVKVIDRTQLILDIFAQHAYSEEGKIQVELAQLEYLLPRLTGRGIHLSRLGGGIGTRGPGEKILEYNKRRIKSRISKLKLELKELENRRHALRKRRKDAMLISIAIVGYTNAGKTTLLNKLTNSNRLTADRLFTTLDPVSRMYILPNNLKVLFHDTVGFLYNLPHHLIEAFKATLEEVKEADLLLHVLDGSNPRMHDLDSAVYSVLKELKAEDKPILTVVNKIDLIDNLDYLTRIKRDFKDGVFISALHGSGIDFLIDNILKILSGLVVEVKVKIGFNEMDKLNFIYEHGKIIKRETRGEHIYIEAIIPARLKPYFEK